MTFKEKLNELEAKLIGSRFCVPGYSLFFGGIATISLCGREMDPTELLKYAGAALGGAMCIAVVNSQTINTYRRTVKSIKEHGKLDIRFAEEILQTSGRFLGYCLNQGLYLAARDYNQMDVFREARKKCKNLIPNF